MNAQMTTKQAKAIIGKPRPLIHVEPRPPEQLKLPIIGYTDLLATLKGYRHAQGLPQLELDHIAGTQDGYIGKLELDIRRAVNESFWDWIAGLKLVLILIPAVDAVRTDLCPCCRQKVAQ